MAKVKFLVATYVHKLETAFRHGFETEIKDKEVVKGLVDSGTVELVKEDKKPKLDKSGE